ncbi:phosphatidylserine lipase ABHD16A-like [Actinia tenebrosa]|uniref:Phosphatidylserine lipase ABHD16A-like n=1 Tax=Actinia tenebrosa TaxID=6105 RepID=A0A6P8HU10_ACTTE|nr:phosphatidylserine lipase ABHD16A-like [Actinia tenebrosa]
MADIVRSALGPRLYRIYIQHETKLRSRAYDANGMEQCGDGIIKALSYAWSICYYTSPALVFYMFRKGFFTSAGYVYLTKCIGSALVILIGAFCIRGFGRFNNQDYRAFLDILVATKASNTEENKRKLRLYDFDFHDWPADYKWNETLKSSSNISNPPDVSVLSHSRQRSWASKIFSFPCSIMRYFVAHAFGRPMIYPGSVGLLQAGLAEPLLSGRTVFLEKGGRRAKLVAADGNEIDSLFMDKRKHDEDNNGNTLVIACEGNAGFYELGLISTPLKAGYSVLGWNHPGFAGSTGLPFPEAEKNAMDVVIQYAINELGFKQENIVLYAWSIGGYVAAWAGMTYPNIGGMVLDATFDDIVPLAQSKMPEALCGFVTNVIKEYFHLENGKYASRYPGPLLIIRRMRDEIIALDEGVAATNLGNVLLKRIIKQRYPNLLDVENEVILDEYLAAPDHSTKVGLWESMNINVEECNTIVKKYIQQHGTRFPSQLGHDLPREKRVSLLMFIVLQYLMDFDAAHCIPLPSTDFRLPWNMSGQA